MAYKAVDRLKVIQQVAPKQLRQQDAAWQLGLGVRQLRRLVSQFRSEGAAGLVSRRLGRRPGNTLSDVMRQEVMTLVGSHYADFGPTLHQYQKFYNHHIPQKTLSHITPVQVLMQ